HNTESLIEEFFRLLTNTQGATDALLPYTRLWLADCRHLARVTLLKYRGVISEFCSHLNADETTPLMRDIRPEAVAGFLRQKRSTTSAATTKLARRILCGFFNYAVDNRTLQITPVPSAKSLKLTARRGEGGRRAFTL